MSHPLPFLLISRKCCCVQPAHLRQMRYSSSLFRGTFDNLIVVMSNTYLAEGFTESFKFLSSTSLLGPSSAVLLLTVGLRLATVPIKIQTEKLNSQRLMAVHLVRKQVYEKIGSSYGIASSFDETDSKWTLNTHDQLILKSAEELSSNNVKKHVHEKGLSMSRLLMLRFSLLPIWLNCNFGMLRYVEGLYGQQIPGFLWLNSLSQADPYMVLPVCMGALALLNIWSTRWMFISTSKHYRLTTACLDVALVAIVLGSVKMMSDVPAIFPIYWCCVLSTGLLETLLMRHPKVKRFFAIGPLPDDTPSPFRSLFRRRIYIPYSFR